jgi:hypothetical protein
VNRFHRCLLHLLCIAVKAVKGRPCGWHWQHLLREFGRGEYAPAKPIYMTSDLETRPCSI